MIELIFNYINFQFTLNQNTLNFQTDVYSVQVH